VLLSAHYRQPLNFTDELVIQATKTLDKYYYLVIEMSALIDGANVYSHILKDGLLQKNEEYLPQRFIQVLKDNLNTWEALVEIGNLAKICSKLRNDLLAMGVNSLSLEEKLNSEEVRDKWLALYNARNNFLAAARFMGFLSMSTDTWFMSILGSDAEIIQNIVENKIEEYKDARDRKDFKAADAIRDELKLKHKVILSVTKDGVTWRKE
jgi:cysteinyl-tRNA synthetase